jgi:hypothetical protein
MSDDAKQLKLALNTIKKLEDDLIEAEEKQKEFLASVENVIDSLIASEKTADSISSDYAITVTKSLKFTSEKQIIERDDNYLNFCRWEAKSSVYNEIPKLIRNKIKRY